MRSGQKIHLRPKAIVVVLNLDIFQPAMISHDFIKKQLSKLIFLVKIII